MIQIYADGAVTYDSRLDEYGLQALRITGGLKKGGTAEIVMPHHHPAYSSYTGYRTIVEIYRDGVLRFRGRALYPVNDRNNTRTVVCEGELCFLQDGISRPYLYETSPQNIFTDVVGKYNAQVEPFKQFKVGAITVTDPNGYVRLESEEAETVLATVEKLTERCGGYIVFTTDDTGARVINWLAQIGTNNRQTIEAGENLLDFQSSGANTDLATALVPYGAKDETTGERLTIKSVNGGKDYIVDETAVAIRGTITKTATWDDVTDPQNLLKKARQYLNECKLFVTSLTLSAFDLSYIDKSIESFKLGDIIRVISNAHGVNEDFQLVETSEDLLNPAQNSITLGKEVRTLTSLDVAGDGKSQSDIQRVKTEIKQDFDLNAQKAVDKALEGTVEKLTSLIEQKADSITLEVSGSLGSKAQIQLKTEGGTTKTAELDLSQVRQAFADDKSAVTISGGLITFNSNTLIVNSTNLQVTADGTIKASNAELSGTATTENGPHKSELSGGRLRFLYEDTEYGGIASDYIAGNTAMRGVTVRLSKEASYMGFSRLNPDLEMYELWYCINFGANIDGRTERHLFFGSAYFSDTVTVAGATQINGTATFNNTSAFNSTATFNAATVHKGNSFFANGKGVALYKTDGTAVFALTITNADKVYVGTQDAPVVVYGSSTELGSSSTSTEIQGSTVTTYGSTVTTYGSTVMMYGTATTQIGVTNSTTIIAGSSVTVYGETAFTENTYVQNLIIANSKGFIGYTTAGVKVWMLYIDGQDDVLVGNTIQPTRLRGSTIYTSGSLLFPNNTGVRINDTAGTSQWVLWLSSSNQVNLGVSNYVTYLRGSAVYLASSGAAVTSDARKKNSIEELGDAYEALLDKLTPVRFKFNNGASGRYHAGFIAQEVQDALETVGLSTQDFGGFVDINKDGEELGLIYSEFIALLLLKIKRQEQRIAALEAVH